MRLGVILAIFLVWAVLPLYAVGTANSIRLTANPDMITADGKSVSTITAEIRDASGQLVPDGTLVTFTTNLGSIDGAVATKAGVARARLTSSEVVGTATISAWVAGTPAVGNIKVELLAPGTEIPRESFVSLSSPSYLVYDTEKQIITGSGGVKILHRGLTITAEEAQFEVQALILRCRMSIAGGPIVVSRGDKTMEASLLYYDVTRMNGYAVVFDNDGRLKRVQFRGADLAVQPTDEDLSPYFDFIEPEETPSVLIRSNRIVVLPRDKIQFHRARVYIDGQKLVSVPLQVIPLSGSGADMSNYIGWDANGLRVDVPLFYSLSPEFVGSVHVRRGESAGWGFYSGNSGWAIDMVQEYGTAEGAQGKFLLNRLNAKDWGVHWQHSIQSQTGSSFYSYVDFPSHKDIFASLNYSAPVKFGSVGMNVYGSKYQDAGADISTDLYLQSNPTPILSGAARFSLLGRTSYTTAPGEGDRIGNGLTGLLYGKTIDLGNKMRLSTSASYGYDWGGSGSGSSSRVSAVVSKQFAASGFFDLIYSYDRDRFSSTNIGRHRLSTSLGYFGSSKWRASVYSTFTLDNPSSSAFGSFSYNIRPTLRFYVLQSLQRSSGYSFSDTQIAIAKRIYGQEAALVWSKSRHRIELEIGAVRF